LKILSLLSISDAQNVGKTEATRILGAFLKVLVLNVSRTKSKLPTNRTYVRAMGLGFIHPYSIK
jgi:L-lysine 2,3-aminomutase